ncbi:hypothetical protein TRFO_26511 [Tritrichomonas foetus]|uniref:Uncharacterized protein n=1 Tax=Tritrichomonas foetus TaxID=1144522 RepID=A0A1J4K3T4_9EUKA|nr:hypothetical protein TRFO_26511 [Tritrichomonas foetus]|eukprot:OHT05634.1 hypothetical protein TRFO_26511 [Tritrichomonas foetus]
MKIESKYNKVFDKYKKVFDALVSQKKEYNKLSAAKKEIEEKLNYTQAELMRVKGVSIDTSGKKDFKTLYVKISEIVHKSTLYDGQGEKNIIPIIAQTFNEYEKMMIRDSESNSTLKELAELLSLDPVETAFYTPQNMREIVEKMKEYVVEYEKMKEIHEKEHLFIENTTHEYYSNDLELAKADEERSSIFNLLNDEFGDEDFAPGDNSEAYLLGHIKKLVNFNKKEKEGNKNLMKENQKLLQDNTQLVAEIKTLNDAKEELLKKAKLSESEFFNNEIPEDNEIIAALTERTEALELLNNQLQEENEAVPEGGDKLSLISHIKQMFQKKNQMKETENQLNLQIQSLETNRDELTNKVTGLEQKLNTLETMLDSGDQKEGNIIESVQKLNDENQKLTTLLTKAKKLAVNSTEEDENGDENVLFDVLTERNEVLDLLNKESMQENAENNQGSQKLSLIEHIRELLNNKAQMKENTEKLRTKISELESQSNELETQKKEVETRKSELELTKEELNKKINSIESIFKQGDSSMLGEGDIVETSRKIFDDNQRMSKLLSKAKSIIAESNENPTENLSDDFILNALQERTNTVKILKDDDIPETELSSHVKQLLSQKAEMKEKETQLQSTIEQLEKEKGELNDKIGSLESIFKQGNIGGENIIETTSKLLEENQKMNEILTKAGEIISSSPLYQGVPLNEAIIAALTEHSAIFNNLKEELTNDDQPNSSQMKLADHIQLMKEKETQLNSKVNDLETQKSELELTKEELNKKINSIESIFKQGDSSMLGEGDIVETSRKIFDDNQRMSTLINKAKILISGSPDDSIPEDESIISALEERLEALRVLEQANPESNSETPMLLVSQIKDLLIIKAQMEGKESTLNTQVQKLISDNEVLTNQIKSIESIFEGRNEDIDLIDHVRKINEENAKLNLLLQRSKLEISDFLNELNIPEEEDLYTACTERSIALDLLQDELSEGLEEGESSLVAGLKKLKKDRNELQIQMSSIILEKENLGNTLKNIKSILSLGKVNENNDSDGSFDPAQLEQILFELRSLVATKEKLEKEAKLKEEMEMATAKSILLSYKKPNGDESIEGEEDEDLVNQIRQMCDEREKLEENRKEIVKLLGIGGKKIEGYNPTNEPVTDEQLLAQVRDLCNFSNNERNESVQELISLLNIPNENDKTDFELLRHIVEKVKDLINNQNEFDFPITERGITLDFLEEEEGEGGDNIATEESKASNISNPKLIRGIKLLKAENIKLKEKLTEKDDKMQISSNTIKQIQSLVYPDLPETDEISETLVADLCKLIIPKVVPRKKNDPGMASARKILSSLRNRKVRHSLEIEAESGTIMEHLNQLCEEKKAYEEHKRKLAHILGIEGADDPNSPVPTDAALMERAKLLVQNASKSPNEIGPNLEERETVVELLQNLSQAIKESQDKSGMSLADSPMYQKLLDISNELALQNGMLRELQKDKSDQADKIEELQKQILKQSKSDSKFDDIIDELAAILEIDHSNSTDGNKEYTRNERVNTILEKVKSLKYKSGAVSGSGFPELDQSTSEVFPHEREARISLSEVSENAEEEEEEAEPDEDTNSTEISRGRGGVQNISQLKGLQEILVRQRKAFKDMANLLHIDSSKYNDAQLINILLEKLEKINKVEFPPTEDEETDIHYHDEEEEEIESNSPSGSERRSHNQNTAKLIKEILDNQTNAIKDMAKIMNIDTSNLNDSQITQEVLMKLRRTFKTKQEAEIEEIAEEEEEEGFENEVKINIPRIPLYRSLSQGAKGSQEVIKRQMKAFYDIAKMLHIDLENIDDNELIQEIIDKIRNTHGSGNINEEEDEYILNNDVKFNIPEMDQPNTFQNTINKHMSAFKEIAKMLNINTSVYSDAQIIQRVLARIKHLQGEELEEEEDISNNYTLLSQLLAVLEPVSMAYDEAQALEDIEKLVNEHKTLVDILLVNYEEEEEDLENNIAEEGDSAIVKAVKRLLLFSPSTNSSREMFSLRGDANQELAEKEKQIEKLRKKLLKTESKASGIVEERTAVENMLKTLTESIKQPQQKITADSALYEKLSDISNDLASQQKILNMIQNAKASTSAQIQELESKLAAQKGHWNELRRALGLPEAAEGEEEEDISDIEQKMIEKIKELASMKDVSDLIANVTERSINLDLSEEDVNDNPDNSQIKILSKLLSSANNTITTLKNEKDSILKIMASEQNNSNPSLIPQSSNGNFELEPLSNKLEELQSNIQTNITNIITLAKDKFGDGTHEEEEEEAQFEGPDATEKIATMLNSPIRSPSSPITNAFDHLRDELNSLTEENDAKEQEINELNKKIKSLNDTIKNLKDGKFVDLDSNPEELERMKELLKQSSNAIKKLMNERKEYFKDSPENDSLLNDIENIESLIGHIDKLSDNQKADQTEQQFTNESSPLKDPQVHTPVNSMIDRLRNQMNDLAQNNTNKDQQIAELEGQIENLQGQVDELMKEKEIILNSLGIDEDGNKSQENLNLSDADTESPIFKHVQSMKQDLSNQCNEITRLKQSLDSSTKALQLLKEEKNSILKSLFPDSPNNKSDSSSQLMDHLDHLDSQMSQQNDEISNIVSDNPYTPISVYKRTPPHSPSSPTSRRSGANQITSALEQMKKQVLELTTINIEHEQEIEELKAENEDLKKEHQSILESIGLSKDASIEDLSEDHISNHIQMLKQEITSQCAEISKLKESLDLSKQAITMFKTERESFMSSLFPGEYDATEKTTDDDSSKLLDGLDNLDNQITSQNDEMSSIFIGDSISPVELITRKSHAPISPRKSQQSSFSTAVNKLRQQINELTAKNLENEQTISELIAENSELKESTIYSQDGAPRINDSPISDKIQSLNAEISKQCKEIEKLKESLNTSTQTIQQLQNERNSILMSLYPDLENDNNDDNKGELMNHLDEIDSKIVDQNQQISEALSKDGEFVQSILPTSRRPVQRKDTPLRNQSLANIIDNMRKKLIDKEQRINELELQQDASKSDIETLQKELEESASTIKYLREEQKLILNSLYPHDNTNNNDQKPTDLIDKLDALDSKISNQSIEIGDIINDSSLSEAMATSAITTPPRYQRTSIPRKARTMSPIASAIDELTQKLKVLTQENIEKDTRISELEDLLGDAPHTTANQPRSPKIHQNNNPNEVNDDRLQEYMDKIMETLFPNGTSSNNFEDALSEIHKIKSQNGILTILNQEKEKQINEFEEKFNELTDEHSQLRAIFDISDDSTSLVEQIEKMRNELADANNLKDQLKTLVDNSNNHVKRLTNEREEIIKLLYPPHDESSDRFEYEVLQPSPRSSGRRDQSPIIIGLTSLITQRDEFYQLLKEKDQKIHDLERNLNPDNVQTRNINLSLDESDSDDISPSNKDLISLKDALNVTQDMKEEIDESEKTNEQIIEDLRNQVIALKNARESIASLLTEVSKRANTLVQQIRILKAQKAGNDIYDDSLNELEQSIQNVDQRLQDRNAQIHNATGEQNDAKINEKNKKIKRLKEKLNEAQETISKLQETNTAQQELAKVRELADHQEKEETIESLKHQVEALTAARESIYELLREVSQRATSLVKQIAILKAQKSGASSANNSFISQEFEGIENSMCNIVNEQEAIHTAMKLNNNNEENKNESPIYERLKEAEERLALAEARILELTEELEYARKESEGLSNVKSLLSKIPIEEIVSEIDSSNISKDQDKVDDENEKKINELKKQVDHLTNARNSISEILGEVSKKANLLVKQISVLKSQNKSSPLSLPVGSPTSAKSISNSKSLAQLEYSAQQIVSNQTVVEAALNNDETLSITKLQKKLSQAKSDIKDLKSQLSDARMRLAAVNDSEIAVVELTKYNESKPIEDSHDDNAKIDDLQNKVESLTKARESIMKLFVEMSRQTTSLVQQIKSMKENNTASSQHNKVLLSIETSVDNLADNNIKLQRISSSYGQYDLETNNNEISDSSSDENNDNFSISEAKSKIHDLKRKLRQTQKQLKEQRSIPIQNEEQKAISNTLSRLSNELIQSEPNDSYSYEEGNQEQVIKLQKQIESLQKARNSMAELFSEVSRRTTGLVKQIADLKKKPIQNKKDQQSSDQVRQLESQIQYMVDQQKDVQPLLLSERIHDLEQQKIEIEKKLIRAEHKLSQLAELTRCPFINELTDITTSVNDSDNYRNIRDPALLQQKIENLQKARDSLCALFSEVSMKASNLVQSISSINQHDSGIDYKHKQLKNLENDVYNIKESLETNSNIIKLTKKVTKYKKLIEQYKLANNCINNTSANNLDNEQLHDIISEIEAVLDDEDIISDYPLVQRLINKLESMSISNNIHESDNESDKTKRIKHLKKEKEELIQQLADVGDFIKERNDIDSILHGDIESVESKSSLVRSVLQLYNIAHEPVTEIEGAEKLKKQLEDAKEEREAIEAALDGEDIIHKSPLVKKVKARMNSTEHASPQMSFEKEAATNDNKNDKSDTFTSEEIIDDDVSDSTLVQQIAAIVEHNGNNQQFKNLSSRPSPSKKLANELEAAKSRINDLTTEKNQLQYEINQIYDVLEGEDVTPTTPLVQKLKCTLQSLLNDSKEELMKQINSLRSELESNSDQQLNDNLNCQLNTLKEKLTDFETQNAELKAKIKQFSQEHESLEAIAAGNPPTLRTPLVDQVQALFNNVDGSSIIMIDANEEAAALSNSSLMQQINEMRSDDVSSLASGDPNAYNNVEALKNELKQANEQVSRLNEERAVISTILDSNDFNEVVNDQLSSMKSPLIEKLRLTLSTISSSNISQSISKNDVNKGEEDLRQELFESKELVKIYNHQFNKIEKFMKLPQTGSIPERAKAIAKKINDDREKMQQFDKQIRKLLETKRKLKIALHNLSQNQSLQNENLSQLSETENNTYSAENALSPEVKAAITDQIRSIKNKFLSLVDPDHQGAFTQADKLFSDLELYITSGKLISQLNGDDTKSNILDHSLSDAYIGDTSETVQIKEFEDLLTALAKTISPNFKLPATQHQKIDAIVNGVTKQLTLKKTEPNSSISQEQISTLENILESMDRVRNIDFADDFAITDSIERLREISAQLESSKLSDSLLKSVSDSTAGTNNSGNNTEEITSFINLILKTLSDISKQPIDLLDNQIDISQPNALTNIRAVFVKLCLNIQRQFSTAAEQQKHFSKEKQSAKRKIEQQEALIERYKEERQKFKEERKENEKMKNVFKQLRKNLKKIQENQAEAVDLAFSICPSLGSTLLKDQPITQILMRFAEELTRQTVHKSGAKFEKIFEQILKANQELESKIDKIYTKTENLPK